MTYPGPPPLPYDLHTKKKGLFIVAILLLTEFGFIPLVLYYSLWYHTNLRHGELFALVTAFFGLVTGGDYALRFWRLMQKDDNHRPINSKKWWLDFYQISTGLGFFFMTAILIGASIPKEPLVRILAIPVPVFLAQNGIEFLISAVLVSLGKRTPVRLSSTPQWSPAVPLTYVMIEDLIAVDGNGGTAYRRALRARYEASLYFRRLLLHLAYFFGVGMIVVAAVSLALVFTIKKEIAFGLGWGIPCCWALLWTIITVKWTQYGLREEKKYFRARERSSDMVYLQGNHANVRSNHTV